MEIEITHNTLDGANCYNLYVNNKLEIEGESFAIIDQVRDSLISGKFNNCTEVNEIARAIKLRETGRERT